MGRRWAQTGGLLWISEIYTGPIRPTRRGVVDDRKKIFRDSGRLDDDDSEGLRGGPTWGPGGVDTELLAWQRCDDVLLQFFP